ncbi:hypothetical protein Ahy_A03g010145 isoform B [Arachis hypogaea]|uniref:Uncharacterized protein n=1 Tax=Arachis hypogaea TaxID=3818 RepID=A0A445DLC9_ARAHY|nr:hypothetical protein Ahy_A03g010145 isoform B [Arachis hypogaea]
MAPIPSENGVEGDDEREEEEEEEEEGDEEEDEEAEEGEEEDDEEEPRLKYQRMGGSIPALLSSDAASCIAVAERMIALGTHDGIVYILDFLGNQVKEFPAHSAVVNDLSFDLEGEYIGSCSDDGSVVICGLFSDEKTKFEYHRPMKAIALDPDYTRNASRRFVAGGLAGNLYLNSKTWLGYRDQVLHSGEGPIHAVKWRTSLVAWANNTGVKVYDTANNQRVTFIERPRDSPRPELLLPHLVWQGNAQRPEVRIVTWNNDELSTDALPVHGFEHYKPKDYSLAHAPFSGSSNAGGQWAAGDEPLYYIVSPKDVVIAKPRDTEDHITWLLQHGWHEKALAVVESSHGRSELLDEVGSRYLDHLIVERKYSEAASLCPKLLRGSASAWERWVFHFAHLRQLPVLVPYMPTENPRLRDSAYEVALNALATNPSFHKDLLSTIKSWPPVIYSALSVISAIEPQLKTSSMTEPLKEALAELYVINGQHEKAVALYADLMKPEVFDFIDKHKLHGAIREKVFQLMMIDCKRAVPLLIQAKNLISSPEVVKQLQNADNESDSRYFLHLYLHSLFEVNPHAGRDFHDMQDSLTALKEKLQRTVYRLTLVKGWNTEDIDAYYELISIGEPDFVEIKGVTYCGSSATSKLTMENVPWHAYVKAFSEALALKSQGEYEVACEHAHSCCVLLAKIKKFKIDGKWYTWIDYDKFHDLVASGRTFDSTDYMTATPSWAVYGAEEGGFDPEQSRYRKERRHHKSSRNQSEDVIVPDGSNLQRSRRGGGNTSSGGRVTAVDEVPIAMVVDDGKSWIELRRYKHYFNKMKGVVVSFEVVAGEELPLCHWREIQIIKDVSGIIKPSRLKVFHPDTLNTNIQGLGVKTTILVEVSIDSISDEGSDIVKLVLSLAFLVGAYSVDKASGANNMAIKIKKIVIGSCSM